MRMRFWDLICMGFVVYFFFHTVISPLSFSSSIGSGCNVIFHVCSASSSVFIALIGNFIAQLVFGSIPRPPCSMASIHSLPTEITAKILQIYVSGYLVPLFNITRVPENDSSALEFHRLTECAELLAMLSVCKLFAAVLPEMIFKHVNIFSVNTVHKFRDAVCSPLLVTGHFAGALTYVEFSFSFGSDITFGPLSTAPCIAKTWPSTISPPMFQ
ncbi:hypothetical protein BDP27DRAFT_1402534 [Rhodocollybia butyracea]|uniref:Uncharacterized protein n=1 Tax=Rhodocollybia butyracea TaxID=206335 RepID=A0A9P5PUH6_9AGAR|nr:hypothetical protein BDP27DRAFT_1402534 [Rhodocollybia butyracea]